MPNYRRAFIPGGTFFLTSVTRDRRPILVDPLYRNALAEAIRSTQRHLPFACIAIVLLPDHWHIILTLPPGDADFSRRMHAIKRQAILRSRRRSLWQKRFWERTVCNEKEFVRLVDYIHYNPVKHGHASCPHDWPFSSFHRFVREGTYLQDWGCSCRGRRVCRPDNTSLATLVGE
ncbi:MAG: transposase [Planctomycetota bacterium]